VTQRDQEDVRRRFAMISYSDPLIWEKGTGEAQYQHSPFTFIPDKSSYQLSLWEH